MPHNIESVIGDIEDIKADLERNIPTHIVSAMEQLLNTAIANVERDAGWRGNLSTSLRAHGVDVEADGDEYEITVGTDSNIAPYAPLVEFGTGSRSDDSWFGSISTDSPHQFPPGYPYKSPDFVTEELVDDITEWVETKPIVPKQASDTEELGLRIARTIVKNGTYAHPFLRPAYYQHEMNIKRAARKAVKKAFR